MFNITDNFQPLTDEQLTEVTGGGTVSVVPGADGLGTGLNNITVAATGGLNNITVTATGTVNNVTTATAGTVNGVVTTVTSAGL